MEKITTVIKRTITVQIPIEITAKRSKSSFTTFGAKGHWKDDEEIIAHYHKTGNGTCIYINEHDQLVLTSECDDEQIDMLRKEFMRLATEDKEVIALAKAQLQFEKDTEREKLMKKIMDLQDED